MEEKREGGREGKIEDGVVMANSDAHQLSKLLKFGRHLCYIQSSSHIKSTI